MEELQKQIQLIRIENNKIGEKKMKKNAPFQYDIVGSFLRPDYLLQARGEHAKGLITKEGFYVGFSGCGT